MDQTITKEVSIHVPSETCSMPGGFRVLHDALARGEFPTSPDLLMRSPLQLKTLPPLSPTATVTATRSLGG